MISQIEKIVHDVCKKPSNKFGYGAWTHHIKIVVFYSKKLSEKYKADKEIVELAALLHDYASVLDEKYYKKHHIYSSKFAKDILEKFNYPDDKIELIQDCIMSHRGSKNIPAKTKEAKALKNADALSHIEQYHSLLHYAYINKKMGVEKGKNWVLKKIKQSWNKLDEEAKSMVREKYSAILKSLK